MSGCAPDRGRGRSSERGSASVELAIVMPLLMLLLMVVVQAGIYFHTQAVAATAARKAVDAARVDGGSADSGTRTANEFLAESGRALGHRRVSVTRAGAVATATVTGRVESELFGVPFSVTVRVSAPVEQVTP
jgi:Flp pilus assembly protein TadG